LPTKLTAEEARRESLRAVAKNQAAAKAEMANAVQVSAGPLDGVIVGLTTSNPFVPVDACLEDSETAKSGSLAKADNVKLLCEGEGMVLGRPQVDDHTIR